MKIWFICNGSGFVYIIPNKRYATRCFEADIDIKIISQQLGHKNVKITYDTYVHVIPDKKIKEMEKLNVLDRFIA